MHIQLFVGECPGIGQGLAVGREGEAPGIEHGLGHRLQLLPLHIIQPQPVALFIGKAPAIEPEGSLVTHLVVLFLLVVQKGPAALFPFEGFKIRPGVVVDSGNEIEPLPHQMGAGTLQRQAEALPAFAPVQGQLVKDGEQFSVFHPLLVLLLPDGGENDAFVPKEGKAAHIPMGGQGPGGAGFAVHQIQVGAVAVVLQIGLGGDHQGPVIGKQLESGQKFIILQVCVQYSFQENPSFAGQLAPERGKLLRFLLFFKSPLPSPHRRKGPAQSPGRDRTPPWPCLPGGSGW